MKGSSIIQAVYSQDFSQFDASWILKVTWTDMSLFADKSQVRNSYLMYIVHCKSKLFKRNITINCHFNFSLICLQKITIQCLLITDAKNTFVVFNYIDVNLRPIKNLKISMGYRFRNFFIKNSYSNQQAAFQMGSVPGNTGFKSLSI